MAHYIPDFDYIKGKELTQNLPGKKGKLIRYYIQKEQEHIQELNDRITEMKKVFQGIARFSK